MIAKIKKISKRKLSFNAGENRPVKKSFSET